MNKNHGQRPWPLLLFGQLRQCKGTLLHNRLALIIDFIVGYRFGFVDDVVPLLDVFQAGPELIITLAQYFAEALVQVGLNLFGLGLSDKIIQLEGVFVIVE